MIDDFITFVCKMAEMVKFLIIRFSSIGDIIQCMDVINGVKTSFPNASIHWIARKDMASFLHMDKRIDKVWSFDKKDGFSGLIKMALQLKHEHFDYIYDAHSNIRSNILRAVLLPPFHKIWRRSPQFTLRSKERWKRFLLFNLRINKFEKPFRGVISYRKPLEKWNIDSFSSEYREWHFPEDFHKRLSSTIKSDTITLVPSANWPMKRWPISHWQELISLLPEYTFIILAGPADIFCEDIRSVAPERTVNLAGKTTLLESCYLVKISNMVVSADTGFLHAADLFHTNGVALMGPTAFGFTINNEIKIMEVPLSCRPCTKDGNGKCYQSIWQKCMTEITPQSVAAHIRNRLSEN